jgi:hypothetical protein
MKRSEMPQNMSFGANGVGRVRSLRQISTQLCSAIQPNFIVDRNPPASSDRQHEEPGGSRDCWWASVPRSTAQNPAHVLASGLLGVPPDLVPDQEGVIH